MSDILISTLEEWGDRLKERPRELELAVLKSKRDNKWFDEYQQWKAIDAIADNYLKSEKIKKWLSDYVLEIDNTKTVGIICAGNIPAVGFHDVLTAMVSGHKANVKLSSKDEHLLPAMISILADIDEDMADRIEFVDKLSDYDAVIATGSDNSARYFYDYFSHVPHLIRKNRQSIAVLSDDIDDAELKELREDVFSYFGLGCRNVSMILLPQMFDRERLYSTLVPEKSLRDNEKYNNNFEYNLALYMLNEDEFKSNDELIFIEKEEIHSRIATLHLKEYESAEEVDSFIQKNSEKLQCIVTDESLNSINSDTITIGEAQAPQLWDYADNVDTLKFLLNL